MQLAGCVPCIVAYMTDDQPSPVTHMSTVIIAAPIVSKEMVP